MQGTPSLQQIEDVFGVAKSEEQESTDGLCDVDERQKTPVRLYRFVVAYRSRYLHIGADLIQNSESQNPTARLNEGVWIPQEYSPYFR